MRASERRCTRRGQFHLHREAAIPNEVDAGRCWLHARRARHVVLHAAELTGPGALLDLPQSWRDLAKRGYARELSRRADAELFAGSACPDRSRQRRISVTRHRTGRAGFIDDDLDTPAADPAAASSDRPARRSSVAGRSQAQHLASRPISGRQTGRRVACRRQSVGGGEQTCARSSGIPDLRNSTRRARRRCRARNSLDARVNG